MELNAQIDQVTVEQEHLVKSARTISLILVVVIVICAFAAVIFFTILMLKYILVPIQKLIFGADALERSDFSNAVVHYDSEDEFGQLSQKITGTMERIVFITKDLQTGLQAVSDANFDIKSQNDEQYQGEYCLLRDSVYHLIQVLSDIIYQIRTAADQVASGADQVANGAQALSQGSTEQAASVQELASTLSEISHQVMENSQSISEVENSVDEIVVEVSHSTEKMRDMLSAMDEIQIVHQKLRKLLRTLRISHSRPIFWH